MRHEPTKKRRIFDKTSGHCAYCGRILDPLGRWEADHMVPRSQGGTDKLSNLIPACRWCNRKKRGRTVEEFLERLTRGSAEEIEDVVMRIYEVFQDTDEHMVDIGARLLVLADELAESKPSFFMDLPEDLSE